MTGVSMPGRLRAALCLPLLIALCLAALTPVVAMSEDAAALIAARHAQELAAVETTHALQLNKLELEHTLKANKLNTDARRKQIVVLKGKKKVLKELNQPSCSDGAEAVEDDPYDDFVDSKHDDLDGPAAEAKFAEEVAEMAGELATGTYEHDIYHKVVSHTVATRPGIKLCVAINLCPPVPTVPPVLALSLISPCYPVPTRANFVPTP